MTQERINQMLKELKEYNDMKKELDSQIKALQDECKPLNASDLETL